MSLDKHYSWELFGWWVVTHHMFSNIDNPPAAFSIFLYLMQYAVTININILFQGLVHERTYFRWTWLWNSISFIFNLSFTSLWMYLGLGKQVRIWYEAVNGRCNWGLILSFLWFFFRGLSELLTAKLRVSILLYFFMFARFYL